MVLGSRRRVGLEGVTSQGEVGSSSGLEGLTSQGEVGSPAGAGVPRAGWIKDDFDDDGIDGDPDDDDVRTSCLQMIPWLSHLSSISSN